MAYTIQQLATMAGITVRALHHYDAIGLLNPSRRASNGYRTYEETDLLKLQQIMFFRELEFSLDDIKNILESKNFDMKKALSDHRKLIVIKRKRMDELLATIDKTIKKINKEKNMNDQELYDGFSQEESEAYAKEAKERWGNTDAYKQSQERVKKLSKDDWQRIRKAGDELMKAIVANMDKKPESKEVQELIAQHYDGLRTFYEPNLELYRGLADMYVADHRFAAYFEKYHKDLPLFMKKAMHAFCEKGGK